MFAEVAVAIISLIFLYWTRIKKIVTAEVGITNQDLLSIVENEKLGKYNILINKLGLIYRSRTRIIP